ncbi:hypothetical protein Glove_62g2 [Diversispora epigaea]|uniref:Uncharacterized protein n=1 Tax=Diversispora epigaea TaxID=1348612 RepID=A0A397JIA8_9GLOM|nr:hypothetical protein Glove_62g2 [Diversispora epigaea]
MSSSMPSCVLSCMPPSMSWLLSSLMPSRKGPNIIYAMARKYQISPSRVKEYMKNRKHKQQVVILSILSHRNSNDFWNKEIEKIYALYNELPY